MIAGITLAEERKVQYIDLGQLVTVWKKNEIGFLPHTIHENQYLVE